MTLSFFSILSNKQDITRRPTLEVESFIRTLDKPSLQQLVDYLSTKISSDKDNIFYSSFFFYRALCYRLLELSHNSLSDYNEAIKLDPNDDRYYYNRAELSFFLLDDPISGLYDCSKAIEFLKLLRSEDTEISEESINELSEAGLNSLY